MQRTRKSSAIAAGLLAAVTLGVFGVLRDYGPESALRRFHLAAIENDDRMLQRVSKQDIRSREVGLLRSLVVKYVQSGARISMGHVSEETRQDRVDGRIVNVPSVVTEVRYHTNQGPYNNIFWVLDHDPAGWTVNAVETVGFPARLGIPSRG